jgi:site-specific recombinase XerD
MKNIQIKPIVHHNEKRLLVIFSYDNELIAIIKKVEGATFSSTHKSWHVADKPEKMTELFRVFNGFASIEVEEIVHQIKTISEKVNKNTGVLNKPTPKTTQIILGQLSEKTKAELLKFKEWMKQKRYSENTIDTYTEAMAIFFGFYSDKKTNDVSNDDINQFNIDYILKKKLSFSYQSQFASATKLFYQIIFSRNIVIGDIERPRRTHGLPKVISKKDVELMLKNIKNQKHRMALTMVYGLGLRRSELLNMKIEHLNSKRKNVTIFNGKGYKDRVLPLSDKLLEQIKKYYFAYKPSVYLIEGIAKGMPYGETSLEKIFHKYLGEILKNHNFTLHCLRHSYATHLMEGGTDLRIIQTLLGHKSSKTTEIYTWVSMKSLQNVKNPLDDFDL